MFFFNLERNGTSDISGLCFGTEDSETKKWVLRLYHCVSWLLYFCGSVYHTAEPFLLCNYISFCLYFVGSMKDYLSTLCMFTKILSVLLYGRHNVLYAAIYVVLCISKCFILLAMFLLEPKQPAKVNSCRKTQWSFPAFYLIWFLIVSSRFVLSCQFCCNLFVVHLVFLPAPADYSGPDTLTYFRGPNLEVGLPVSYSCRTYV